MPQSADIGSLTSEPLKKPHQASGREQKNVRPSEKCSNHKKTLIKTLRGFSRNPLGFKQSLLRFRWEEQQLQPDDEELNDMMEKGPEKTTTPDEAEGEWIRRRDIRDFEPITNRAEKDDIPGQVHAHKEEGLPGTQGADILQENLSRSDPEMLR